MMTVKFHITELQSVVESMTPENIKAVMSKEISMDALIEKAIAALKIGLNATWQYLLNQTDVILELTEEQLKNLVEALATGNQSEVKKTLLVGLSDDDFNEQADLIISQAGAVADSNHAYVEKMDSLLSNGFVAFISAAFTAFKA
jgi:hypothetical protein